MKHSILLVEHDAAARSTITRMVEALGYRAIGVAHAELALGVLKAVVVDVMLLGWLPDDDQAALVAIARRAQPRLRVIVASAAGMEDAGTRDIDAFVRTPFSLQDLQNVLDMRGFR